MSWATPEFTNAEVDAAGKLLAEGTPSSSEADIALDVINNWRAIHSFPLNTFQMRLRHASETVYPSALVAQRLKRVPSIVLKLQRFPQMRLSQMQDIGGCRAVVQNTTQVRRLERDYKRSRIKHKLVSEKNYILDPKNSGYRGVHLVYRYSSDRKTTYNGRLVELQIRSRLQHAWATAVETVGTFLQHSLKSSEGPDDWLRFFSLCGSAFARVENSPLVPGTPTVKRELNRRIRKISKQLDVAAKLEAYGKALQITEQTGALKAQYFLLSLVPSELTVYGYNRNELTLATDTYLDLEKRNRERSGAEAVLVSADSMKALRRAYPNYFLDTEIFLDEIHSATAE